MRNVVESPVRYTVPGKNFEGLMLESGDTDAIAAVVLLPDWRGRSQLARDHARFLIELGCTVVIAELYGDGFSPDDPSQVDLMVERLMENRMEGVAALSSCVDVTRQHVGSRLPIFCLGYSAGGMIAVDYGRSGAKIAGIILCSALLRTTAPGMSMHVGSPVLMLQGTQDEVSPMTTIVALVEEMDNAGSDFRLELYGQAHHAFDNPEAGTDPTARLVYSPQAARLAQRAIAEFIRERAVDRLD